MIKLKLLEEEFCVCQIKSIEQVDFQDKYVFVSKTNDELSLVCQSNHVPKDCIQVEEGFKTLKIMGVLDFSLIGIIAKISTILEKNNISIFVNSTYNTDYILVKKDKIDQTMALLKANDYVL